MPECPAEGCEYSGVVQSVAAHYSGKRDDVHSGGYHDAKALLEGSYDPTQEDMPGEFDPGGSQTEDPEPDGGSSELDFPENPDATDDPEPETEPSRSRCPECGSGNYASTELTLQNISGLSEKAKRALESHEYHCHDCGEVFDL